MVDVKSTHAYFIGPSFLGPLMHLSVLLCQLTNWFLQNNVDKYSYMKRIYFNIYRSQGEIDEKLNFYPYWTYIIFFDLFRQNIFRTFFKHILFSPIGIGPVLEDHGMKDQYIQHQLTERLFWWCAFSRIISNALSFKPYVLELISTQNSYQKV